jgi:hypothetical protein
MRYPGQCVSAGGRLAVAVAATIRRYRSEIVLTRDDLYVRLVATNFLISA